MTVERSGIGTETRVSLDLATAHASDSVIVFAQHLGKTWGKLQHRRMRTRDYSLGGGKGTHNCGSHSARKRLITSSSSTLLPRAHSFCLGSQISKLTRSRCVRVCFTFCGCPRHLRHFLSGVVPGGDPTGTPIESLGEQTGDRTTRVVNVAAGACFISIQMHPTDFLDRNFYRVHSQRCPWQSCTNCARNG